MENSEKLIDETAVVTPTDVASMKVNDLRRELKSRGLPAAGNKSDLVERLQNFISKGFESLESPDDVNEDEVLGDVTLLTDDAKSQEISEDEILGAGNVKELEASLGIITPKSPTTVRTKTTLIRSTNIIVEATKPSEGVSTKVAVSAPVDASKENDSGVSAIKIMTAEERLALRAKKFNQPLPTEVKLKVRSERFGLPVANEVVAKGNQLSISKTPADMDKLKERAKRFGQTISTGLKQVEDKEKLLKRKQRFGTLTNTSSTTAISNDDVSDKKKRRAERFGIA